MSTRSAFRVVAPWFIVVGVFVVLGITDTITDIMVDTGARIIDFFIL